jgi:UDP-N-acetylglucosamine--N-acetylmuramyl-(pentapeptide) pyrophosphoryl-undecaprenol N-acetylglucosamine transferase
VAARSIIKSFKPDLIFVKGGYVSLPIIIAASYRSIPIVMHESDVVLGLANRIGAKWATKVGVGYPVKYYSLALQNKLVYTGIPIRHGFFNSATTKDRQLFGLRKDVPTLIITAGSQGARAINQVIKPLLPILLRQLQIIHLTGPANEERFIALKETLPTELKKNYHPFGYLKEGIESAVRVSDLAIARSGSTIAELAAGGVPMILIPLPTAAGDHQVRNAEIYTKEGAAVTIRQHNLTSERLMKTIVTLLADKERLTMMSKRAKHLSIEDAADNVVRIIEETLRKSHGE